MAQLTLFDSSDRVLVDDERGRVAYTPGFVDLATAQAWFAELRAGVSWRSERRMMYDREVDVPRLVGHFRLDPAADSTPAAILDAARRVVDRLDVPFNSVGLNLYRDGRDSVAPHNDHLNELRKGFPIALVSLGATRRMTIARRSRRAASCTSISSRAACWSWTTRRSSTTRTACRRRPMPVGERISLAFRVKRPRDGGDEGSGVYR